MSRTLNSSSLLVAVLDVIVFVVVVVVVSTSINIIVVGRRERGSQKSDVKLHVDALKAAQPMCEWEINKLWAWSFLNICHGSLPASMVSSACLDSDSHSLPLEVRFIASFQLLSRAKCSSPPFGFQLLGHLDPCMPRQSVRPDSFMFPHARASSHSHTSTKLQSPHPSPRLSSSTPFPLALQP